MRWSAGISLKSIIILINNHRGLPSQAFEYIKYNGGLESEKNYPYRAHNESICRFNKSLVSATVMDVVNITQARH